MSNFRWVTEYFTRFYFGQPSKTRAYISETPQRRRGCDTWLQNYTGNSNFMLLFQMGVSENSGFSPQIIHFNRVFHYKHKPSILGYPYFWKPPDDTLPETNSSHLPSKPSQKERIIIETTHFQVLLLLVFRGVFSPWERFGLIFN